MKLPTTSILQRPLTIDSIVLAILSVYNKQGLLDLAKGLIKHDVRLLASGGTAKRKSFSGGDYFPHQHFVLVHKRMGVLALCLLPGHFLPLTSYHGTALLTCCLQ